MAFNWLTEIKKDFMWVNNSGTNYYLDATQTIVVEEGDERQAFLLVRAGGSIHESLAIRHKLFKPIVEPPFGAEQQVIEEPAKEQPETPSEGVTEEVDVPGEIVDAPETVDVIAPVDQPLPETPAEPLVVDAAAVDSAEEVTDEEGSDDDEDETETEDEAADVEVPDAQEGVETVALNEAPQTQAVKKKKRKRAK